MANHKSAEKRARQTERRTAVNTARRSRVRSSIKKVEEAIKSGDKKAAAEALRAAQPEIQRGFASFRSDFEHVVFTRINAAFFQGFHFILPAGLNQNA